MVVGVVMLVISSPVTLSGSMTANEYNELMVACYIRKFFMIFGLMTIIGVAMLLKILVGVMYSIGYRCTHTISEKSILREGQHIKIESKVSRYFEQVKPSMYE
jgi:hypothetical protein